MNKLFGLKSSFEKGRETLAEAQRHRVKNTRGDLKSARKSCEDAIKDLKEADSRQPNVDVIKVSLALAYLELGDVLKDLASKSKERDWKEKKAHKNYKMAAQYGHPEAEDRIDALLLSTASGRRSTVWTP